MATSTFQALVDKADLSNLVFVPVEKSITSSTSGASYPIPAGSPQSPATVNVTANNVVPSGTSYFTMLGARIGGYPLPYTSSGAGGINATYIEQISISGGNITFVLKNLAGAWTGSSYDFKAILVFKRS